MVAAIDQNATRLQEDESISSVSIIIPTYNERENIGTVLNRCSAVLEATKYEYELVVVDDDSPDRTWEFVEEAYSDDEHVRAIRRTGQRGLALSITEGFRAASMEYGVVIDGDLQHPPEKIPELLAALDGGADIAIGSRHTEGGGIENWTYFRRAVSKGATALAKFTVPTARGISDPMSGLFAVRQSVVADVELEPRGYKILLEILSKCEYDQVVEVPYTFRERIGGESKLTADQYQQFIEHVLELSISEYAKAISEHPRRFVRLFEFFGVGAIGVIVNMIAFYFAVSSGIHYLFAGGIAFLAAVQWNFVGNWAITFDRPRDALLRRYLVFHAVCGIGLIIYEITLAALVFTSIVPLLLANIGAICVSSLWNFIGSDTAAFADWLGEQSERTASESSITSTDVEGADN